jgi:hypothetical protein
MLLHHLLHGKYIHITSTLISALLNLLKSTRGDIKRRTALIIHATPRAKAVIQQYLLCTSATMPHG